MTVTFDVFQAPCTVTLTSYQSTSGGHTHQVYSTGTDLGVGLHTLTVAVTCGTDNQLDLFIGPTPPPEPNGTTDIHAFAVTPECAPLTVTPPVTVTPP